MILSGPRGICRGERSMAKRVSRKRGTGAAPSGKRLSAPTQAAEVKRALASQLEQAINEKQITKAEMARRMETSRSQLNRILEQRLGNPRDPHQSGGSRWVGSRG